MASTSTIELEEVVELLRKIARGEIPLMPASERPQDEAIVAILRAGPYALYLLKDAEGVGSFECLVHDDGRRGDIDEWFAATGQLPLEPLSEAERVQLEQIMKAAAQQPRH